MKDCSKCKRADIKCCHTCKKDANKCNVWHHCGSDCPEYEVITNADRIRSMTDEELAELFTQYSCEDADYASLLPIDDCLWGTKREVIGRNLNWLQSEVKGE